MYNYWRFLSFVPAIFMLLVLTVSASVFAGPSTGVIAWDYTYGDDITGDNEFKSGSEHYWFTNSGADDYNIDKYERPNAQTVTQKTITSVIGGDAELAQLYAGGIQANVNGTSDPSYHAYLDIVSGSYAIGTGDDSGFMFFGMELYGDYRAGTSGVRADDYVFGDGTQYRIRMSGDPKGANGLMIGSDAGTDYSKDGKYDSWNAEKTYAFQDTNGDVGGPGGIAVPDEGTVDGYNKDVIADGETKNDGDEVLWTRYRHDDITGRSYVEFALDLDQYQDSYNFEFDPTNLGDLVFETTRGLKDNQNYLWNDEYNSSEAGSPYSSPGTGNIYELDNLRAGATAVPAPGALLLGSMGCVIVGWLRNRRSL